MIIKLTELRKDDKGKPGEFPIWVNFAHVQTFNKSSKGKDTHLKIMGQAYLFVKESPEQIADMLYPKFIAADAIVDVDMREVRHIMRGAR